MLSKLYIYLLTSFHWSNYVITSTNRKADALLINDPIWKAVNDRDRRDIFEDAIKQLAKKEKVCHHTFIALE